MLNRTVPCIIARLTVIENQLQQLSKEARDLVSELPSPYSHIKIAADVHNQYEVGVTPNKGPNIHSLIADIETVRANELREQGWIEPKVHIAPKQLKLSTVEC